VEDLAGFAASGDHYGIAGAQAHRAGRLPGKLTGLQYYGLTTEGKRAFNVHRVAHLSLQNGLGLSAGRRPSGPLHGKLRKIRLGESEAVRVTSGASLELNSPFQRGEGVGDQIGPFRLYCGTNLHWLHSAGIVGLGAKPINRSEVKRDIRKASVLNDGRVVFNMAGNKYRIVVSINSELFHRCCLGIAQSPASALAKRRLVSSLP
jgi:hypothetical protein